MSVQRQKTFVETLSQESVIPVVENHSQFLHALKTSGHKVIIIRNCDLFEISLLCQQVTQLGYTLIVDVDHMSGVHADLAGLHYLIERFTVTGITSTNQRILTLGKALGLQTILHVYAADSTGLTRAIDAVDPTTVDIINVSPALVVPSIRPALSETLPCPFIASGLVSTQKHVQAILQSGALGVAVGQSGLW